jgi:ABC-type dipeptide/oligopeptide/nickel transport system permease subunit
MAGEKTPTNGTAGKVPYKSQLRLTFEGLKKDKLALMSSLVMILVVLATIFAPWLAPDGYNVADPGLRLAPPLTQGHVLGMDGQGRDILVRILYGGRISLPIAAAPVVVSGIIGLFIGLLAGYSYGALNQIIMRVMDVFFAFPMVLLAIAIAGIMGPGMMNVMLSIAIVLVPYVARVAFSATMVIRDTEFVEAARAAGAGRLRVMFREILPNIFSPILVYCTTLFGNMVIMAAGLSFLGLGIQPPVPDWGIMCSDGRSVLSIAPHVTAIPGVMILIVSLSLNLIGDGLRDALDPRLRNI